jgi:3-oxoacyl-[acyl-carrier protein] reductase
MDVTKRVPCQQAARDARRRWDRSVLVNNAGINKPTDFDRVTDADWDESSRQSQGRSSARRRSCRCWPKAGKGSIFHIGR